MAQNIYDTPEFFAAYSRLDRSVAGLDGALEWPAVRALLPALSGLDVLDLGCGFGWFCRWARQQGAAHVTGVDCPKGCWRAPRKPPRTRASPTSAPIWNTWSCPRPRSTSPTVRWPCTTSRI